ncbi:fibronectin type III domain-containing protein [Ekhidna sp. MALMAid0563]|uniref:fibronectin type III domain-containing protein n=1 Tax=Ekhidna sp. MALMAid0563 TaxID=3143937 RepID=UPI0032DF4B3D
MRKAIIVISLLAVGSVFASEKNDEVMACAAPGSFTLNNPSSSNVGSTSISLSWSASSNATNYTVYYKLDNSSSWTSGGTTSSTSKTVTGLSAGETYDFKITANRICITCPPPCNEPIQEESFRDSNIRTETMEPPTPNIRIPLDETTSSFTARWFSAKGASSYKLDVSTSSSFSSGNVHTNLTVTGTSKSVTGLDAGVRYYYRVRAVNSNGESSESASQSAYTVPDSPVLNEPTSITNSSFQISWNPVTGAESYRMDVSTNSLFTTTLNGYDNKPISGTSTTISGLDGNNQYFVRLRAYDTGSGHTSSNSSYKTALTLPDAPQALSPSSITQTGFIAQWEEMSGVIEYRLDVSSDDFITFLTGYNSRQISAESTSHEVSGLDEATNYQYRVRAINATGPSSNSDSQGALTIPETPTIDMPSLIGQTVFTANWEAVEGADNYLLDISSDNFNTLLSGYPREVTGTSFEAVGLEPATTYQYRVRSENATDESPSSISETALTIPATPISNEPTGTSQTGFVANWEPVNGANHYLLDVSADNFSTFLEGYEAKIVTNTTEIVSGLDPGTSYSYRVRAENETDETPNSNVINVLTFPADPFSNEPANITQTSFNARWEAAEGIVEDYRLDLSESSTFSSFVEGYDGKAVETTTEEISGLNPGTEYFYRVRSNNGSGQSNNSEVQSVLTIPATPSITGFSEKSATRVKVSWTKVTGADNYEIIVSENSDFTTLVPGNNPKVVSASLGEEFIQDLNPATVYYVKVRSKNGTGASAYSEIGTTSTTDSDGNSLDPKIEIANADVASINFNVTGGLQGITSVKLFHKKRTEEEFTEVDMEVKNDGVYFLNVQPEWLDDFGMDYRIEVEDGVGVRAEFSNKVLRQIDRVEINSVLSFGSGIENYSIISVPYEMNSTIEDIFERLLGEQDNSKWRIVQYRNEDNFDYTQGLSKEPMTRGEGYWFISTQEIDLNIGSALAPENTHDNLFQMNLTEGWNQIGNPYPFDVNWSDVLSHNSDVLGVSPLFVFDPSAKSFKESNDLIVFGGGFVFTENAVTLEIPIAPQEDSGRGRIATSRTSVGWEVSFNLKSGEVSNQLSSIGMHSDASEEVDTFDQVVLPRFVKYAELKSLKENHLGYQLSQDFVDLRPNYQWDFQVESNASDQVNITWDVTQVPAGTGIFIHDKTSEQIINMKDIDSYNFESDALLKIYALEGYNEIEGAQSLGTPYPNPIEDRLTIPFDFGLSNTTSRLIIYNLDGSIVFESEFNNSEKGLKKLEWDTNLKNGDTLESGTYLYSIYSEDKKLNSGRIIKK